MPIRKDYVILPVYLRMHAPEAYTGRGVTIAFIDSGFYPHPCLTQPRDRIRAIVDVTQEKLSGEDFRMVHASSWHGTMVASVACGSGHSSKGYYRGIAPGSDVVLIKAYDGRRITSANIAKALRWVIKNAPSFGIRIVNISLGANKEKSEAICRAVQQLTEMGIVVIAAAGNSRQAPVPPASCTHAITVGGIVDGNSNDARLMCEYGSSRGPAVDGTHKPDIVAPSHLLPAPMLPNNSVIRESELLHRLVKIPLKQLIPGLTKVLGYTHLGKDIVRKSPREIRRAIRDRMHAEKFFAPYYQHVDGTSFAAPIVSSIVAQMLEANGGLSPALIKYILKTTARRLPDIDPMAQGAGLVNAAECVQWALAEREDIRQFPVVREGRITFSYPNSKARTVELVGDLTAWQQGVLRMHKVDNVWRVDIPHLRFGKYAYKYLVDETHWTKDPHNPHSEADPFGGENSLLKLESQGYPQK